MFPSLSPGQRLGFLDPDVRDAVDAYAEDLLRRVDPDRTAEIIAAMFAGQGGGAGTGAHNSPHCAPLFVGDQHIGCACENDVV